jgi:hypothetical protein
MNRSDNVFFFTLIDFLLQVFFFGLLLYVFSQSLQVKNNKSREEAEKTRKDEAAAVQKIKDATGISNLTELTDVLTNLGPVRELKGTADFISRAGGADKVRAAVNTVEAMGGVESANQKMEKLRKLEEGSGRPPCLFNAIGDRKVARPLATITATDTAISFNGSTPDLEDALRLIGRSYDSVHELTLAEFRKVFLPLVSKKPECRYTLRFRENTRLVYARDAARFAFYLNIESIK